MPEPSSPERVRVVLYGRAGCHLCADARAVVAAVCAPAGTTWSEVDIDAPGNETLRAEWTDHVPVVTVDARVVDVLRVDADRLRAAVSRGA